jgi:DNA repair exonuclease SbcCD nuclease subunit
MKIRIIGDVHGKVYQYLPLTKDCDYSIQLGDVGFKKHYNFLDRMEYDKNKHFFIPGNHDDYDNLPEYALGDFGTLKFYREDHTYDHNSEMFWVRGAFSVDHRLRREGIDWWRDEELNHNEANKALETFANSKPETVLSHDCPAEILPYVLTDDRKIIPSHTCKMLQEMWKIHQPRRWFFAHHHQSKKVKINRTNFICLNELEAYDIEC